MIRGGIDVDTLSSLRSGKTKRPSCLPDDAGIEVLTCVSRGFEEYRGFPQAMQTIALLQAKGPSCMLIVGSDVVAYGEVRAPMAAAGEHGLRKI